MANPEDQRLDRIEDKIDKLSEAMVSLARTEEKILSMEENNRHHYNRMNRFSEKLDKIETQVNNSAHTVQIINRVSVIGFTVFIGTIINIVWF